MATREILHRFASRLLSATLTGGAQASLTTALTGANNDLVFTARSGGTAGNTIAVIYLDPGAISQALSVTVSNAVITVHLATDGAGAITSTAALILAAVNAAATAKYLVSAALASGNDGTGVVTALGSTSLAGGGGVNVITSAAADLVGFDAATFNLHIGALFSAGLTYKLIECDTLAGTYTDVVAAEFIDDHSTLAANTTLRVGYVGSKEFVKLVVTPTGDTDLTITVSLGRASYQPPANPN